MASTRIRRLGVRLRINARLRTVLKTLRTLHPPVVLYVHAPPLVCLETLAKAARPHVDRLHLRDLYTEGRRYYVRPVREGFQLTSDSRLLWGGRRARTPFAATLYGSLAPVGDDITCIRLHAGTNWWFILRSLLVPAWMSGIAILMPWPLPVVLLVVALLFGLSLVGNRMNAALQATDLVYFVQTALADLPAASLAELAAPGPEVVTPNTRRDFREQWQKFYEEHQE